MMNEGRVKLAAEPVVAAVTPVGAVWLNNAAGRGDEDRDGGGACGGGSGCWCFCGFRRYGKGESEGGGSSGVRKEPVRAMVD